MPAIMKGFERETRFKEGLFSATIARRAMGYYLGVDIGSVNSKLALIDENGKVIQFDTEKVTSSPRAAVSSLIARLGNDITSP